MGRFNEFRKRLAGRIVTYYYNRKFEKAVIEAESRHAKEGTMIYVIDHFERGKLLSAINRKQFRTIKHAAQKLHRSDIYWSSAYNTGMLKEQCWYHTANGSQEDGLSAKNKEIRRLAFIREGLRRARLYK